MKGLFVCTVFLCLFGMALGDCYMQNPRGSNDRLNGNGVNRNNGNRLFDSQNNAKGGYCWGPSMTYYADSILSIEWTAQHACGSKNTDCNMVIQYMCGDSEAPRDGSTTNTIPDNINNYNQRETPEAGQDPEDAPYTYGMHEGYFYYQLCKQRQRNMGLFIADRADANVGNLKGKDARFTRQNNNANRHGFECTEERDYYPYWHPTPWKDVAVLVSDESRCKFYRDESQNVKDKGNCSNPDHNNKGACEADDADWSSTGSHGISAPICQKAQWIRDNHLGNAATGRASQFNWTLPDEDSDNCVLRIRYNITTDDYDAWVGGVDATSNGNKSPVTQDPYIVVNGKNVSLALNTNQYGRTFQDRSHVFGIKPKPGKVDSPRLFNLNVRGKRGNIVQSYPATEYDFVPEQLYVRKGDYIHFQWTGCDTNPQNYAGEGTRGTDRSNIVQLDGPGENLPGDNGMAGDSELFAHLTQPDPDDPEQLPCLDMELLLAKNNGDQDDADRDKQNCMKMNNASPYFNGGVVKMGKVGEYNYMSTRNNNYTNRSQKAVIVVVPLLPLWAIVLLTLGGAFFLGSGGLTAASFYAKGHPGSAVANALNRF